MSMPDRPRLPPSVASASDDSDYQRLFELSLDLLCVAGLDGFFQKVNPAWTRVLGWSEAELLSRPVADFMHPEDRERTLQARAELAKGIVLRGLENRYMCRDGSHRWLSWQSAVEIGANKVFAVARDITEQRRRDREYLILSKLESTGIFAAGIAHDYNNLLGGLLLNLDMVALSGATNDKQEEHLQQARQSIYAAEALTQQLVTFANGSTGPRRTLELSPLLRQSLELSVSGSELRTECVIAANLHPVEADEAQLSQVIRGLVLNAREAILGAGTIRLSATNVELDSTGAKEGTPCQYVRIAIEDDGVGIAPEILPKIFDPYFSTKPRGARKGMGLGLTICRTVIQRHGGTIAVESTLGRGTTVVLHLPAVRRGSEAAPPETSQPAKASQKILVMDDEPLFREIVAQALRRLGYDVELATNGEDAVALYEQAERRQSPFAAVLLDLIVRDGRGGADTLKLLRDRNPTLKAVLMTAYGTEEIFKGDRPHGFNGVLIKPFSAETLRLTLARMVPLPNQSANPFGA